MRPWNKRVLDREELRVLYKVKGLSLAKIGKIYDCDAGVVLRNMREYGLSTRNLTEATTKVSVTKTQLIKWYRVDKLSMFEIARKLGCTHSAIVYKFRKLGIKSRGQLGLTPELNISKDNFKYFYNTRRLSLDKIAKIWHRSEGGIQRRFDRFGIKSRGNLNRACKYRKTDFSGNLEEKAYMVGFRLGDLNVIPGVSIIQVRCSTTHLAQVRVIRKLFSPYTTPHVKMAPRGTFEIACLVNRSFDFLIPKEDKLPKWVLEADSLFWAFFAGYADAEGCIAILKTRRKFIKRSVNFQIASYDKTILRGIGLQFDRFGINSHFRLASPKGTVVTSALKRGKKYYSRQDAWRLEVNDKQSLWKLIHYWKRYVRHREKVKRLEFAENNLIMRNAIKINGCRSIDLSIPNFSTHLPYPYHPFLA